jgi:hypothetical protein
LCFVFLPVLRTSQQNPQRSTSMHISETVGISNQIVNRLVDEVKKHMTKFNPEPIEGLHINCRHIVNTEIIGSTIVMYVIHVCAHRQNTFILSTNIRSALTALLVSDIKLLNTSP